jgi:hypothetical protein
VSFRYATTAAGFNANPRFVGRQATDRRSEASYGLRVFPNSCMIHYLAFSASHRSNARRYAIFTREKGCFLSVNPHPFCVFYGIAPNA